MTFFAIVARLLSVAMSLGIIICVGQMARLIAGRRAGFFAATACALGVTLTYYGQVTNLDVPYLFWSVLSLFGACARIAGHEPARFREAALFAAAAVATKDQAYAIFLLSVPLVLLLWFSADSWPRRNASGVIPVLLFWTVAAIVLLLLIDGAITNPGGFAKRIAFLTGPASQDYANYPHDMAGRLGLFKDVWAYFTQGYVAIASILAVLGLWFHAARWRDDRPAWVAGLLPFLAMVSFTICFNFVALRTDDRFLLPQAVLATVYIGVAAEKLVSAPPPWLSRVARFLLAIVALLGFYQCMGISAAFLLDPRYDAERWMAAHVRAGDTIETYGQNAYLPRFPTNAAVTRVGQTPPNLRNPLPGVTELPRPYDAIGDRNPRFIVISVWWVQHHLDPGTPSGGNRVPSAIQQVQFRDLDAVRYFSRLQAGRLDYYLVQESRYAGTCWPPIHIHESLDEPIRIFERMPIENTRL